jgi:SAM-dependent methyltransferase
MAGNDAGRDTNSVSGWVNGEQYEGYVGRWSRLVGREFLRWIDRPAAGCWLDVGCGTGVLCEAILQAAAPTEVVGIDVSDGMLAWARERLPDARVQLMQASAMSLPFTDETFDTVVSGLVLNFVPDPQHAVREMVRVAVPDVVVGLYVWDYSDRMQMMRHFWDAAAALDPAMAGHDEGKRFPMCRPEPLEAMFRDACLVDVEHRAIDIPTVFRDFDDYWTPFLSGQAPAPRYAMSLDERRRAALRERLRDQLPVEAEGSIHLIARAWAVKGRKVSEAPRKPLLYSGSHEG